MPNVTKLIELDNEGLRAPVGLTLCEAARERVSFLQMWLMLSKNGRQIRHPKKNEVIEYAIRELFEREKLRREVHAETQTVPV